MRRIVVFDRVSADGYFTDIQGRLDWAVPDDEIDKAGASASASPGTGAILFGRRTYEMFESYWPNVRGDASTAEDPHAAGRRSAAILQMANWINAAKKVVFSRTRKEVTWNNSELLHELDPRAIEAMKAEPGKDMMLFGSGSIVSQLTDYGLIDEYTLVVSPLLLGNGRTLVSGLEKRANLTLIESKAYATGNVVLRYKPANSA